MVAHVGQNARELATTYGNVSAASIGAIQRGLLTLEEQGGDAFFGQPTLDINDLMQTVDGRRGGTSGGRPPDQPPRVYSNTLLLWLLSELFETSPEVGDVTSPSSSSSSTRRTCSSPRRRPRCSKKIEQVVRLIRSGRRRLLRDAEPARHPGEARRPARQSRPARAAPSRHATRKRCARRPRRCAPIGVRRGQAITELGVGGGAGFPARREGAAAGRRARLHRAARLAHRSAECTGTPGGHRSFRWFTALTSRRSTANRRTRSSGAAKPASAGRHPDDVVGRGPASAGGGCSGAWATSSVRQHGWFARSRLGARGGGQERGTGDRLATRSRDRAGPGSILAARVAAERIAAGLRLAAESASPGARRDAEAAPEEQGACDRSSRTGDLRDRIDRGLAAFQKALRQRRGVRPATTHRRCRRSGCGNAGVSVRRLMAARAARLSSVCGSAGLARTQSIRAASRGHGAWARPFDARAWPPARCGGVTSRRADAVGRLRAEAAAHQVQAAVDAGSGAGRSDQRAVLDVEHVGIDVDARIAAREVGGAFPARRRRRPSSSPAAASTYAPRHRARVQSRAPRFSAAATAASNSSGGGSAASRQRNDDDVGAGQRVDAVCDDDVVPGRRRAASGLQRASPYVELRTAGYVFSETTQGTARWKGLMRAVGDHGDDRLGHERGKVNGVWPDFTGIWRTGRLSRRRPCFDNGDSFDQSADVQGESHVASPT